MSTKIYLIRHSEKMRLPHSRRENWDRIQPLTGEGERRAKELLEVEELRNADAAYCSPYARTISTIRYLQEADCFPLFLDERLRELAFGGEPPEKPAAAGPSARLEEKDPRRRLWEDRDLVLGGGESVHMCGSRMAEAISEIVRGNPGRSVLVGTHGHAICAFLASVMEEIDLAYERTLTQPALFRLVFEGEKLVEIKRLSVPI